MGRATLTEARGLVAPPTGLVEIIYQDGITPDIQREVLAVSSETAGQTAKLAEQLRGATPLENCENVFRFVRGNIRYQLDPPGKQFCKTPSAVIGTGFCDCKGYATLTNDLLRCLGVASAFRFVSFNAHSRSVTHVYSVAYPNGTGSAPVVLDACLPRFNQEKPYTYKDDRMTQISRVSGIGRTHRQSETPLAISGFETEEELTLKLALQGAEYERNHAVKVQGIGSTAAGEHHSAVKDYTEALMVLNGGPLAVQQFTDQLHKRGRSLLNKRMMQDAVRQADPLRKVRRSIARKRPFGLRAMDALAPAYDLFSGARRVNREERRIGFLSKLFNKVKNTVKSVVKKAVSVAKKGATLVANGAKFAAKTALKAGKFALRVVTAPIRLLAKGLLEVFLPKMAPMFLYLFITNPDTIASLPEAAARKRRKAVKFAKFITDTVGMGEAHFMKALRNGIQKQMGGSPEQVLANLVQGPIAGVHGIGLLPLVALVPLAIKAGPWIMKVIDKIMAIFGKKPAAEDTPTAEDAPNPEADFEQAPAATVRKIVAHVKHKPASQRGEEPDTYANEMAQEAEENATHTAIDQEPGDTPVDAPLPDPWSGDAEPAYADPEEVSGIAGNYL